MKSTPSLTVALAASFLLPAALAGQQVRIESPRGGVVDKPVVTIEGSVAGYKGDRARIVINGIPQDLKLNNGRFRLESAVAPGANLIEVIAGAGKDRVSFFSRVSARDVKIVLTWDTPTDVDLWVIDPKGEKCYYGNRATSSGGNLDVDIIDGYGPETFTMAAGMPGEYSVQVQYYGSNGAPITNVTVYLVLYEGTPREQRRQFRFVMTRQHQVYQIARFTISPAGDL